jgi:hypothetical protein
MAIAGQHRLGWVKIGLAVRFAQGLRLNSEPDPNLPSWQQEERRRVFWSTYILDRFVCCRARPPTILDVDCTVMLPTSERHMRVGALVKSPTLAVLNDIPDISVCKSLGYFAQLVLVASILGRIIRYNLQQRSTNGRPPWDFRSDFAKISTTLLSLETLFSVDGENLSTFMRNTFGTDDGFDRGQAGHFIWSRGLYHLTCCLLHHPFFLYRHRQQHRENFPRSFARTSILACKEHAGKLSDVVQVVQETDCCARGSIIGYFAVVAGSIHKLYEHSTDLNEQAQAQLRSQAALNFLQHEPVLWENFPRMVSSAPPLHVQHLKLSY